uniref:Acid phosphatase n=1 Tax=Aegilops tauschii subsp. strangulata TaxID=200361 RepID=A0A453I069_AEGTS
LTRAVNFLFDCRLESFDHREFDWWVETGEAPAFPSSLRLYREVRDLGFKTFLLTGRSEAHEGRKSCRGLAMYAITKAFCVAFVMTLFSVFAAVPVGGAAATFGRATAAAPKGNLHQTLPHNSASKFCAPSPLFLNYRNKNIVNTSRKTC